MKDFMLAMSLILILGSAVLLLEAVAVLAGWMEPHPRVVPSAAYLVYAAMCGAIAKLAALAAREDR